MKSTKQLIETTVSSTEVFKGKLLHVFYDEATLPDGSESSREWIKHPGACAVVPLFENGDVMLIRQYRYPVKQIFWEVPAGKIDPGESQDHTAGRELQEESGLKAEKLDYVGHFYPAIGYSDEVIHIYVARGLEQLDQKTDDDEFLEKERILFSDAIAMVHSGEINDGKTVICLLKTQQWLEKKGITV